MPANMAISLIQILTKLLIGVITIEKDFILLQILSLMAKVSVSCDQLAFKHRGVEIGALEMFKWMLLLMKDKS
jgi:hypothetical protein